MVNPNVLLWILIAFLLLLLVSLYFYKKCSFLLEEKKQRDTEYGIYKREVYLQVYNSLFINVEYINKVDLSLKKQQLKIKTGQCNDLSYIYKKLDIPTSRQQLLNFFDHTFITNFPEFIEIYNRFFSPKDQIQWDKYHYLAPEVRIYALAYLGIYEIEQISCFLNLSVNTIYVYKAKLKKKLLYSKEEFEEAIVGVIN